MELPQYIQEKKAKGMVYMPYLTLGDPSMEESLSFACTLIEAGADLLELGIPFSDPVADGPVIQAAMDRSLKKPLLLRDIFSLCKDIHRHYPHIPLILLSYLNPILNGFTFLQAQAEPQSSHTAIAQNLEMFLKECQQSGVRALVIPDLPFDQIESELLRELGQSYGVCQILMAAPNTSQERLKKICQAARGWIYYVSSLGVTGIRKQMPEGLKANIQELQGLSGLPVLAGFGFHQPEQIEPLKGHLDGIIVGSMNQSIIAQKGTKATAELKKMTAAFVKACH